MPPKTPKPKPKPQQSPPKDTLPSSSTSPSSSTEPKRNPLKDFDHFLDDGHPYGIPDSKLVEVLKEGSHGYQTEKLEFRLDRQRQIPAQSLNIYAIQPNSSHRRAPKLSRQKISGGGGKNSNSMGVLAQIVVPMKGLKITAQQAREAFRASIVPERFGRVYYVVVDAEGGFVVDGENVS